MRVNKKEGGKKRKKTKQQLFEAARIGDREKKK